MAGQLHAKDTLFLRVHAGEAKADDGMKFELSTGMGASPIIHCENTGLWWTIDWRELIALAVKAGITKPATSIRARKPRKEKVHVAS